MGPTITVGASVRMNLPQHRDERKGEFTLRDGASRTMSEYAPYARHGTEQ